VANETLEDYALRYTAKGARRWSNARVANTALGIVSFLALEAIGGTITLNYGFINAFWAIMVVGGIIFLCGLPISYYAARYGVDIDLLTRGAGFGYIGSTVSSLIYASFTFIFFAIEAAIMSMALNMATGVPLSVAYIISALVVIPLVTHGISRISRFQAWTQPLWGFLQIVPLVLIATQESEAFGHWLQFEGVEQAAGTGLSLYLFGACAAVIFPLMAQNGEQADFLRFLPANSQNKKQWWFAVIGAGPGWVVVGIIKLLVGSFLAVLALNHGVATSEASDPAHMYAVAFGYLTQHSEWAIFIAAVFVVISQLKINVTNAYAGSIAWGNFFSRLTHNHPGRVVWLFFNVSIALLLMELGLYQAFEQILSTYATLVVAWIGCVVADLVINKPLGLSPKHIEFRRSHLYDINPVGVGSMIIASVVGFAINMGMLGEMLISLAPFISLSLPFITVPLLAYVTQSRYYLNRADEPVSDAGAQQQCIVCENVFDREDMGHCPSYEGAICSLCCALDARCGDRCRPEAYASAQMSKFLSLIFPAYINEKLHSVTGHFLVIFGITGFIIAALLNLVYFSQVSYGTENLALIAETLWRVFFLLLLVTGVLVWLYVLAQSSARLALNEVKSQSGLLEQEILAHEKTNCLLLEAKNAADMANKAKSRYLSGVSHELRTPLNTIYGYAQLMEVNNDLDDKNRKVASIIKRSGQHLSDVIEGLLDISKIEARKLEIHNDTVAIRKLITQLEEMFSNQARARDIHFRIHNVDSLPSYVTTDEKRLRQILLNLLSNAFKYTDKGSVELNISYRNQVARFSVRDTGIGIAANDQDRIFDPFERVQNGSSKTVSGTGLGLTISRLLAELMGGRITLSSEPGKGSEFTLQILLPSVMGIYKLPQQALRINRQQKNKTVLVVDDEKYHCQLINDLLRPAGFDVKQAHSGEEALELIAGVHVDLFILDVNMPGMNGWTLLSELRQNHLAQPVIMLSADPYEADGVNQMKDHFSAYLNKPIEFDRLISQIERLLDLSIHCEDESHVQTEAQDESVDENSLAQLSVMRGYAKIGYLKGLTDCVAKLEEKCHHASWFSHLTLLVEACDIDGIIRAIDELGGASDSAV
jgi:signal transduction histidine kinase/CheY-like chemotaxis protein/purine-cytosine permease-like protein